MKKLTPFILVFALASFGCGDDHDHGDDGHSHDNNGHSHGEEFNPEEEGCEHMADGPFADAAVGESIAVEHTRVNVTLNDAGMGAQLYQGDVLFEAGEAAEYLFFLSEDVDVVVADADDNEIALEAEAASTICPNDIATILTYDLAVGTYTLSIGPTESETIGIVHEEAGGHSDE